MVIIGQTTNETDARAYSQQDHDPRVGQRDRCKSATS